MSEEATLPAGDTISYPSEGDGPLSVREAALEVTKGRDAAIRAENKKLKEDNKPEPVSEPPQAVEEEHAAAQDEPPSETQEADQVELPPIEPPRSWTKEDKELFTNLPRETQERLAERERSRESDFLRRQQEAAEHRKALEAERVRAAQARQQYEHTIPQVLSTLQAQIAGEFGDLKSWADVEKMAQEDPFRYQRFDVAMKKANAMQAEMAQIQQRQSAEIVQKWNEYRKTEDAKFAEKAPEMSDAEKAKALRENASKVLRDIGFKDHEMSAAWEGKTGVSLRDHRVQLLIRDATLWREAQAKAKQARQASVPPVQKPGTARPAGASQQAEIQTLKNQLDKASGVAALRIATKLHQLERAAAARK